MPTVSVIIPTYNRVHSLPVSIDSVLRQTYNDLEVIVVDDGSTDGTESYVRGLTDGRVRYIRNMGNHGPASARNLGVRLAEGEYVAFQDSDDEWHPDKLEKQMSVLLHSVEKAEMVYCEYTRYHGQARRETVPSKALPPGCKQGDILPVLLLQPMIGTPTIVVKKSCFVQTGGFNETLHTFEDYEFTLRFSRDHRIGFVEESLVKVNDSSDSVDKRFADRIRTQAYIIRNMIASLREYGLLWEKLSAVQRTAEHLKCHDVFLEELHGMADLFLTEQEREIAAQLAKKTEQSDAKQNQHKEAAHEALVQAKQRLVETYMGVYGDVTVERGALERVLRQTEDCVEKCMECFEIPEKSRSAYNLAHRLTEHLVLNSRQECLSLLTDNVKTVEELERYIYQQQVECNVCEGRFYRNRSRRCPWCEADDRERLLIAFLQELRPEEGGKLAVLQMTSLGLVENYLLKRRDMRCDSLDLDTGYARFVQCLDNERYDILIIFPDSVSQDSKTDELVGEWKRIMKTGGVCLVFPTQDGEWRECVKRIAATGLRVNEVGVEWFGAEFYQTHGIDSGMVLPVLTKGGLLAEL